MPVALSDTTSSSEQSPEHPRHPRQHTHHAFPALEHFRIKDIPPAAYYIPDFITPDEEEYLLRKIEESPQPKWKTVGTGRRLQYWGGNMSKNGVLLPEPLPDFLVSFPDIIERIESFLDIASGKTEERMRSTERSLGINQVLVNEYQPGQGISPHEDGPAFRPLVATISLGSHSVIDIHHYTSTTSPSPPMVATTPPPGPDGENQGRPIAAIPLAHLLVLPRSLLILSSSLYTSHLHGIAPRPADLVVTSAENVTHGSEAVAIANVELLGDAEVVDRLRNGGQWEKARGTRTSLTFRHAEKTLKGGALSIAKGAIRRF